MPASVFTVPFLEAPMDRATVISVLLLVGFTWLLYKLTVLLEPRGDKPASSEPRSSVPHEGAIAGGGASRQKLIHQRLRK